MALLWTAAVFLSAFLLFLVQPMTAKMILPMLGGTPAVWNTCMLFYQTVLLAGYGYVHVLNKKVAPRLQPPIHVALLIAPLVFLPIGLPKGWAPPDQSNPIPWVFLILSVAIGLPFFALSTTAPLLQRWFSWTEHPSAKDPYFLYAASNAGSMLALLGYPLVIEPWLPLKAKEVLAQTSLWSLGYAGLVVLIGWCAWIVHRSQGHRDSASTASAPAEPGASSPLPLKLLFRWVALACIPSSLLLGATTYITLNVAAIPLFWVVPLALYLLSFIIVFAKWPLANHRMMVIALPVVLLLMVFDAMPQAPSLPDWLALLLPVIGVAMVAMVCHGELARTRPPTDQLTMFYLLMSVGGALGGLFNALIAPVVFTDIYEYELAMIGAAFLLPGLDALKSCKTNEPTAGSQFERPAWLSETGWVAAVFAATVLTGGIIYSVQNIPTLFKVVLTSVPLVLSYATFRTPLRFGCVVSAVLIGAHVVGALYNDPVLYRTRTFFGVLTVKNDNGIHRLKHGTTNHGMQNMNPDHRRDSLSYFHPTNPYGQVFAAFSGERSKKNIAVTGLGIAALANYCETGQALTFYEIDPEVTAIAQNTILFTYYPDSQARGVIIHTVHGDARLKMEEAENAFYDMIILDAFSSDAIPVHLLTREAIEMYLQKLAPGGALVVHVSNRYVALQPVLASLAEVLHLVGVKQQSDSDDRILKFGSHLVVLGRAKEDLGPLASDPRWTPLERWPNVGIWTDDFSNVISVLK